MTGASAFAPHDHRVCVQHAMDAAERACSDRGLRLTEMRRRVLRVLLREHRAIGAYDILHALSRDGERVQPPTVYRALDFLTRAGLAHRVHLLNAYVACAQSGTDHQPALLVCETCHAVAEEPQTAAPRQVTRAAEQAGFAPRSAVVEMPGQCPACRAAAQGADPSRGRA